MPMSEEFQIIHTDHIVTILQGDDVVGHVIPTFSGYVPFVFSEETSVFEELTFVDSLARAKRLIKDEFYKRERAA